MTTYYLSPSGNNSNPGGILDPWLNMDGADLQTNPGDTVLCRGGTYNMTARDTFSNGGSGGVFVTYQNYPNETPIFDAAGISFANTSQGAWQFQDPSQFIKLVGLKLINSAARGAFADDANDIQLIDCTLEDISYAGARMNGNNMLIDGCIFRRNVWANLNRALSPGWPSAVKIGSLSGGSNITNPIVRNCVFDTCWGEGMVMGNIITGSTGAIHNNTIYNCFSAGIYLGDSQVQMPIYRNLIYCDGSAPLDASSRRMRGLYMVMEGGSSKVRGKWYSNVVIACENGIRYWHDPGNTDPDNTYQDLSFYHNVLVSSIDNDIQIDEVPAGFTQPSGTCELKNNIVGGNSVTIGDLTAWVRDYNCYDAASVPAADNGVNSFAADPLFYNPGSFVPADYKIRPGSPAEGAGTFISGLVDYEGISWDNPPHIGAFNSLAGRRWGVLTLSQL